MLQCLAVCCSMLQCVAVSCSVLQCLAVCCSMLQYVAVCCSVLQCVAVCCRSYTEDALFHHHDFVVKGAFVSKSENQRERKCVCWGDVMFVLCEYFLFRHHASVLKMPCSCVCHSITHIHDMTL